MTTEETTRAVARHVRLDEEADDNYFVYDRETGKLIGRVWREANGEWWATAYLSDGRNVSGGKSDSRLDAVAKVWRQHSA